MNVKISKRFVKDTQKITDQRILTIKHQQGYLFTLTFENGESKDTDLRALIEKHVNQNNLNTAHVNSDWGCLEFNNGMVDIDPKTLYCYAASRSKANGF